MKQLTSIEWIAQFLAAEPPRAKSMVMTVFGDAIVPHGGAVWMGSLIALLAPFGVNERLLRTSVYRLAQEGWLAASRDGRRSVYAIAPDAVRRLARANRRIYLPPPDQWDGLWTMLLPSAGLTPPLRAGLRKELLWQGYAPLAPGVLGHPAGELAVLDELLARVGAAGQVFVCRASEAPQGNGRPLGELVADSWDLSGVVAGYRRFIDSFAPLLALLRTEAELLPDTAFVVRSLTIHAYRRVQLQDPGLPLALLPQSWPGEQACALAQSLYRHTVAGSERHIVEALQREDAHAKAADEAFFERFGGLARD
ncbi:MAG: phenylacetic acid degradation operon negative regulatory protein PaaX [Massilia sp.]